MQHVKTEIVYGGYAHRLEVSAELEGMELRRFSPGDINGKHIFVTPDELNDLVRIAKFMQWEFFNED